MRQFPTDDDDRKEAERLAAQDWMLEQLKLNPSYVHWGPHEDYMWKEGEGWNSRKIFESWSEFGPWKLDELNEVVNFYFQINRSSKDCENCAGRGIHPDAQWITESWYRHTSPFTIADESERTAMLIMARFGSDHHDGLHGRGAWPGAEMFSKYGAGFQEHCASVMANGGEWSTAIMQDEVDVLWEADRLQHDFSEKPTAAAVNAKAKNGFLHDAINAHICYTRRCERLGIPFECPECDGHGHLFIGPAFLSLVLWVLHPRKGCSRGIEINHIQQEELPVVYTFLRTAAERNARRFEKVVA